MVVDAVDHECGNSSAHLHRSAIEIGCVDGGHVLALRIGTVICNFQTVPFRLHTIGGLLYWLSTAELRLFRIQLPTSHKRTGCGPEEYGQRQRCRGDLAKTCDAHRPSYMCGKYTPNSEKVNS